MSNDLRFLIVDDFEMIRFTIKNALTNLGQMNVDEAEDGGAAVEMIEKALADGKPYAMVVCDWMMPVKDGLEVLKFVRTHPVLKEVPFVMLTAEAEQSSIVSAFRAGATEYWVKPLAPDMLEMKLTKHITTIQAKNP